MTHWPPVHGSHECPLIGLSGGLKMERPSGRTPVPGGTWYEAHEPGDGLVFDVPAAEGSSPLTHEHFLWADLLLEGSELCVFELILEEANANGASNDSFTDSFADSFTNSFTCRFGLLNHVGARLRLPLDATTQKTWKYQREGAWLKPLCLGGRVDPSRIARISLLVKHKGDRPVRWCMSGLYATPAEPPKIVVPFLNRGPLLDEFGQSTLVDWPGRSKSAEEIARLHLYQARTAPHATWPNDYSRWGGWRKVKEAATGFFRTHHDGKRWWLLDPDGHPFWSSGLNCVFVSPETAYEGLEPALSWMPDPQGDYAAVYKVRPGSGAPTINYLAANLIRTFGKDAWYDKWAAIAIGTLRGLGFNTVANWSDWEIARGAAFGYVRTLEPRFAGTPSVFRDFPDVFHPAFARDAARVARALESTAEDPALIGYFLMNEPTWGFSRECVAAGMLFSGAPSWSRKELAGYLRARYGDDESLSQAWGVETRFSQVESGPWPHAPRALSSRARHDLEAFSTVMVERLFGTIVEACRKVDPNHLNLGARYYTIPPEWALKGMRHFDVFSINCYRERIPHEAIHQVSDAVKAPVIIGEWHFGALDAGLPASGLRRVKSQEDRGRAFRVYIEDAASHPCCVGAHYFTLYDQSALGRFDGENYQIGFLDVCNRPYEPICKAARASHERLYRVAAGEARPFDDAPEYLPRLYI